MKRVIGVAVGTIIVLALGALFVSQTTLAAATADCFTWVANNRQCTAFFVAILSLILIIFVPTLYSAARRGATPRIPELPPVFFFWLGIAYLLLLLTVAAFYVQIQPPKQPPLLLGGVLPIGVPWFGALGAVIISLEGVFAFAQRDWDPKFNFWHIGRPLFGAVLGIVAFFTYVMIVISSGSVPAFLDDVSKAKSYAPKDYIIYYIVAFLAGYREETFRELIRRVTDLILKPGSKSVDVPEITFKRKDTGASLAALNFGTLAIDTTETVTISVENSGKAVLKSPVLTLDPASSPGFSIANDHVSGTDLNPGAGRSVDVIFAPTNNGTFNCALAVTGGKPAISAKLQLSGQC